jgi:hypothetical protein
LRPLVADVERWARENVEAAKGQGVSRRFQASEWVVELDLYAGGSSSEPASKAIGVADMRGGLITPHKDLRDALDDKSDRYGTPKVPYLIVVADAKDQLFGKKSINAGLTDAVLGDEIVEVEGGQAQITRVQNGFWHGATGPRNQHVSAVLLLPGTDLWKLREENRQPVLAINPSAERPLPDALKTLRRFEADNDLWVLHEGKMLADLLGLPNPWPPDESS